MQAQARAGIDIVGAVLRYAEVEQYGQRYRLLRLGSCQFDFDVSDVLLQAGPQQQVDTVAEALGDIFAGCSANHIRVALHPQDCTSFFTPLAAASPPEARAARFAQEATLLTDTPADALHLAADPTASQAPDYPLDWWHVLGLETGTHHRIARLLQILPRATYRPMLSTQGAAKAVARLIEPDPEAPYSIAIGQYADHIEYALCHDGRWFYSYHTPAGTVADAAYFTIALLNQLRISIHEIGQVLLYGQQAEPDPYALFGRIFPRANPPQLLNPIPIVDIDPGGLDANFAAEAYAPCIGVAL